jgi:MSHA biogenesis protein MshJ
MKTRWLQLAARFDALTERERILAFVACTAALVLAVQMTVLGPLARKETLLRTQVALQRQQLQEIDGSIAEQARAFAVDPDRPLAERLDGVQGDAERLAGRLRTMERGLVAPERMAPLLESMLRANGRLRMVSLRTLPATPLSAVLKDPDGGPQLPPAMAVAAQPAPLQAQAADASKAATLAPPAPRPQEPELLYRHGVELTVRGSYLDLVDYMNTLESLPTQLFWGRAQLEVEQYPTVRLTLTLYTMSLDDQWMKL